MRSCVAPVSLPTFWNKTSGRHLCLQCTWTQPSAQKDKTTIRGDKESTHKVILQQESTDYKWLKYSLRSKRFRLVSEQRKTEERDFRFWPREKWNESQKMKEGGWGGEGRKRLQTNPGILKTFARQRTERLISSASRTMYSLRAKQQH